jgi:hypothetical protein
MQLFVLSEQLAHYWSNESAVSSPEDSGQFIGHGKILCHFGKTSGLAEAVPTYYNKKIQLPPELDQQRLRASRQFLKKTGKKWR